MRDPDRIKETLELLHEAWAANPDQRLGQLVCNASRAAGCDVDPFNTEEPDLNEGLRRVIQGEWAPE
jgi:uncharacterized protein YihD (DUF1040 family)